MNHPFTSMTQEALAFEPTDAQPHLVIAISGGSAAGKSTITRRLGELLGAKAATLSLDSYQLDGNYDGFPTSPYRYDDPRNFQLTRIAQDIRSLQAGESVEVPSFTVGGAFTDTVTTLESKPILLVDGLYAADEAFSGLIDRTIYVRAPLYARFLRRLFRLEHEHGLDNPEAALRHSFGPTLKAHRDLVTPQELAADVVVTSAYSFKDTISRYGLTPMEDTGLPTAPAWRKGKLVFRLGEYGVGALFQIRYDGEIYSQFPVDSRHIELLPPPTSEVFKEY